jgi:hypothetical protein
MSKIEKLFSLLIVLKKDLKEAIPMNWIVLLGEM